MRQARRKRRDFLPAAHIAPGCTDHAVHAEACQAHRRSAPASAQQPHSSCCVLKGAPQNGLHPGPSKLCTGAKSMICGVWSRVLRNCEMSCQET
jgi:hypothetical protein